MNLAEHSIITDTPTDGPNYEGGYYEVYRDPGLYDEPAYLKCCCGSDSFKVFSPCSYSTAVECLGCGKKAEVHTG
jgi:hypothetical protein